jgi:hypothetical protein
MFYFIAITSSSYGENERVELTQILHHSLQTGLEAKTLHKNQDFSDQTRLIAGLLRMVQSELFISFFSLCALCG